MYDDKEELPSVNRSPFAIELSGSAIEVLHGLFFEGPLGTEMYPARVDVMNWRRSG